MFFIFILWCCCCCCFLFCLKSLCSSFSSSSSSSVTTAAAADCTSSSSSSASTETQIKYDVFLSFRGEDTRNNFTSHLYDALTRNQIKTFIDYNLPRGEGISSSLLKSIEESRISVVILSKDYASSKWCLEELVKVIECKRNYGQMIIPVFYQVDPSHVRKQTGDFKVAFLNHEKSPSVKKDQVQRWRAVLNEVANLSGWHAMVDRPEAQIIKEIIEDILKKLNQMSSFHYPKSLVGMESRVLKIESLLDLKSSDVRYVGIWGMGGVGKTTLAKVIYDKIYPQFESCCFLSNTRDHTVVQLQDALFSTLLEKESVTRSPLSLQMSFTKEQLCRKKVLIVVDNVDSSTKLHQLLLTTEPDMFGLGSRILLTSRDKQVLKNITKDRIYAMKGLNEVEALKLFSLKAFRKDRTPSDRTCQSQKVIKYAKGNPLALTTLGSALLDRSREDWESALKRLEDIAENEIRDVLRTSFDALDYEKQRIFLDIACFFSGKDRDYVAKTLEYDFPSIQFSITVLIERSLIAVPVYNKLEVHDLLREMAQRIILDESQQPGKRSRLCTAEDICCVLKENKGTDKIKGISLDMSKTSQICINFDAFEKMSHLRILKIYRSSNDDSYERNELQFSTLQSLSNELRYLEWTHFPMKSLPSNFNPEYLVVLQLPNSKVKKLWSGTQNLVKLKQINLSGSQYLTSIPDLSKATNIEKINLRNCGSLEEVHSSIEYLTKLVHLNFRMCYKLRRLPRKFSSDVLKSLDLSNCPRVEGFPDFGWNQMESLLFDCSGIKDVRSYSRISSTLSSNFDRLKYLRFLWLKNCSEIESFPEIMEPMKNVTFLDLWLCKNLKTLPNSINKLEYLKSLDLRGSAIKELPTSITNLCWLWCLNLDGCKYLESLPKTVYRLTKLKCLLLHSCESLRSLPELPQCLRVLEANNCKSLETILPISFYKYRNIYRLMFGKCLRLDLKTVEKEAQYHIKDSFNFLYPGKEVPEWFSHQSIGSSIALQFPINLHQCKNIAFCVVFELEKSSRKLCFKTKCAEDLYLFSTTLYFDYSSFLGTDHVLIWHRSIRSDINVSSFDFYPCIEYLDGIVKHKIEKHCKVKSCGVHCYDSSL